ncbi:MarR family transcriptional regulator [Streptomyces sp. NPDC057552]|uniref:MarR family transcriptional regulator n=1 Tax=Streptomyces sp. NPDC057552 TaxID=3350537 RepID=UPI0036B4198C
MAKPGYGKRSTPDQQPRTRHDFALLPTRERYVAGFVDHLPDGAAMSVKHLAKQLPLYGQQAISTALTALSVAGHLRRVRCPVGAGEETRWVFRTFWSRTARDNEWWNTYLAAQTTTPAPGTSPPPPPPGSPTAEPPLPAPPENPRPAQAPTPALASVPKPPDAPTAVPRQRNSPQEPDTDPAPDTTTPPAPPNHPEATRSPAYLALARLGHRDHRLTLSAHDCATLEAQATQWLARGVSVDYLTNALTAGLPTTIDHPAGLIRRRLTDKLPPHLPTPETTPRPTPTHRILIECTTCGRPGQPEALPDGLCRPCRTTHTNETPVQPTEVADIKAHMANLRDLLKPV